MNDRLAISKYVSEAHDDWRISKYDFPLNVWPKEHWPIPFFGNPATANGIDGSLNCAGLKPRFRKPFLLSNLSSPAKSALMRPKVIYHRCRLRREFGLTGTPYGL